MSPRARNGLEDVSFAEHMGLKTRSELIQEGFDKNIVDGLSAGRRTDWLDIDALARNKLVDQLSIENPSDFAMQEVEFAHRDDPRRLRRRRHRGTARSAGRRRQDPQQRDGRGDPFRVGRGDPHAAPAHGAVDL